MILRKFHWKKKIFIWAVLLVLLIGFCYWQNNDIVVTNIEYKNEKIPQEFDGYKILHVSDLHNKEFGSNQARLVKHTQEISPDIIVITGDLIDSNRTDLDIAMAYIEQAVEIAPVYFVSGNHEKYSGVYAELSDKLKQAGVIMMDDNELILKRKEKVISLFGLKDISFNGIDDFTQKLQNMKSDFFSILLSHRPELLDLYARQHVDLVFSGHAHGGQFRLPFIGGLIAPDQGFFPKITAGSYKNRDTTIIVSRGLGNSVVPIRIFNRPELVTVTLRSH
ncbi:metallophosphoesterase [Bacillaceae bacterium Marseille-Q3522]|nr:metallophosphoesterase [Bacillaceae bacterium Marseille-Q3522]